MPDPNDFQSRMDRMDQFSGAQPSQQAQPSQPSPYASRSQESLQGGAPQAVGGIMGAQQRAATNQVAGFGASQPSPWQTGRQAQQQIGQAPLQGAMGQASRVGEQYGQQLQGAPAPAAGVVANQARMYEQMQAQQRMAAQQRATEAFSQRMNSPQPLQTNLPPEAMARMQQQVGASQLAQGGPAATIPPAMLQQQRMNDMAQQIRGPAPAPASALGAMGAQRGMEQLQRAPAPAQGAMGAAQRASEGFKATPKPAPAPIRTSAAAKQAAPAARKEAAPKTTSKPIGKGAVAKGKDK